LNFLKFKGSGFFLFWNSGVARNFELLYGNNLWGQITQTPLVMSLLWKKIFGVLKNLFVLLKIINNCQSLKFIHICITWNAAWYPKKYSIRNRKIRFGLVPHIDKEFFGTGIES